MKIPAWMIIDVFCLLILCFILQKQKALKIMKFKELLEYYFIVVVTMAVFLADLLAQSCVYYFNDPEVAVTATYVKYIIMPLTIPSFFEYIISQMQKKPLINVKYIRVIEAIFMFTALFIVLVSIFNGWAIRFNDKGEVYEGSKFKVLLFLLLFLGVFLELFVFLHRKHFDAQHVNTLIVFSIPPALGAILYTISTQYPFFAIGITYSLMVTYVNILNRNSEVDYLTRAYNRQKFELVLDDMIREASNEDFTFAVMMIDINKLKEINECFGNEVGDEVLIELVRVLNSNIRKTDFISRVGGDEFCAIIKNNDYQELDALAESIKNQINKYRIDSNPGFKISVSIGYDIYDTEKKLSARQFIGMVDWKMYADKERSMG
ncbi:diguanylate cyclase (GGDEF) domain-containing protein [Acetitomaculum ruminis DSM 5522]|uniref:Diguanylate cyclase (GGDEF) domain-containing protein n=1 Tax=Acetitomaculum ruminis DSM 5522 TaxID=1120918 RepID=A0A1I1A5N4_9FIRM|nr:GGDEF domain-containing protein [Acetitomaculum ruminis]SFB32686.1 diguanylate cyclase (GGDEF) domain-containing protein [Acetitomaculum ruminis DSM 5522]